jgi:alpha-tubulin suppressor-like RCC1 family protein
VWHACALLRGGTVACWGDNALGTLGTAASPAAVLTATAVPGIAGVQQVEVGFRHTCALLRDATVVCWGKNDLGELGRGTASPFEATPAPVMGLTDVTQITAHSPHDGPVEGGHTCALRRDGAVVCWGKNDLGQLGDGTTTTRAAPVTVSF